MAPNGLQALSSICDAAVTLVDFPQSQVELYVITQLVVYGVRGSSRDVDCSTGRRPMEWADEPPPLVLLYQVGFGWVPGMRCQKVVV